MILISMIICACVYCLWGTMCTAHTYDTCIYYACIHDAHVYGTCAYDTQSMTHVASWIHVSHYHISCIIDAKVEKEVLVNFAWVTRPERQKGAKDEVKRPEGPPETSSDQYFIILAL